MGGAMITEDQIAEARKIVTEKQRPSISLVQRVMQIRYHTAALLLEALEKEGTVSAIGSDGTRKFLGVHAGRRVLDPCSGSRMMWFNRTHPDVVFGDRRRETLTVTDNSRGNKTGTRTVHIDPDTMLDFRSLPYDDCTFKLVAFDPPHLVQAGPKSWLAAKYGKLSDDWRADLRRGFEECFRVLDTDGVLVFKWNETQIKLREVLALTPHEPLFGNTSGKRAGTHWMVFMKPNT